MSEEEKELLTKYGCTTLFEFVDVVMDFDMCLKILKDYFKLQQENTNLKQALNEIREYIKTLRNYHMIIEYENKARQKIYGSEKNFVSDVLQIIDKYLRGEK